MSEMTGFPFKKQQESQMTGFPFKKQQESQMTGIASFQLFWGFVHKSSHDKNCGKPAFLRGR